MKKPVEKPSKWSNYDLYRQCVEETATFNNKDAVPMTSMISWNLLDELQASAEKAKIKPETPQAFESSSTQNSYKLSTERTKETFDSKAYDNGFAKTGDKVSKASQKRRSRLLNSAPTTTKTPTTTRS